MPIRTSVVVAGVIVGAAIAAVTNVATEVLPTSWQPYRWVAWPLLAVLVALSIALEATQRRGVHDRGRVVAKALARQAHQHDEPVPARRRQRSDTAGEPESERRPEPTRQWWRSRPVLAAVAAVLAAGLGLGTWRLSISPASIAAPPAGGVMSGPSCTTGDALPLDTSGSWKPLEGTAATGCGEAMTHEATNSGGGANWVFRPGAGKTCLFHIYIPDSPVVTARNVTYQAWDTQPGDHHDRDRIGENVYADQQSHRGDTLTVRFGPTSNGTIDLQLYDDHPEHAVEVADWVTATCR